MLVGYHLSLEGIPGSSVTQMIQNFRHKYFKHKYI